MEEKKAVQKPTAGINDAPVTPKAVKLSANELLKNFLLENKIVLMLDTLDMDIKTISDGSIIIGKPKITAKYTNA